jgi:iron complex outermembrane receptor protein
MGKIGTSRRAALAASAGLWAMVAPGIAKAQTEAPPAPQAQSGDVDIDENIIIVTAQKRAEVLADVPQSITVLTGETLERQQANNFQDYLALIPGLSLEGSTRGVSRITLRGINTGGVASTVGIYVDEVPFGSSSGLANGAILAGDFDTFDVDRLEVLRGPQGTLYGASSLGGVLKFVTNRPKLKAFEARGQAGIDTVKGGDLGYSAAGMFNAPLGDKFAIRASGFYRFDGGFIDSIGNNPIASLLDPTINIIQGTRDKDNVNDVKTFGGRISALFEPTDALSIRLTAMAQNIKNGASDYFEANPETLKPLYGDMTVSQYHPEFTNIKYRVYSGVVDWDVGFANLLSSTSYGTFKEDLQTDLAFLYAPLITYFFGDPVTRPLSAIIRQTTATKKFAQELRLSSPDSDKFEWLLGGYYTHEKSGIDPQNVFAVEAETENIAADIPPLVEVFLRSTFEEYAAFANATWHFTPRFDLTFGGRLSHNKQKASQSIDGPLAGGLTEYDDVGSSESVFNYSVAPRFEINDDVSIYARVASGYRPGGPNVLPPGAPPGTPTSYDADRLTSYEVGLKADWFNRALSLDIAAFYLDWKDIQLFAVVNDTGVNANGGTAVSKGVELTATARPVKGLSFALNGAYTDAYLTQDTDPVVGGLDGDPLPYVPKWSWSLSGDYEWTVMTDATAYVGSTVSYTGNRTPDFGTRDPDGDLRKVPKYTTIALRAGIDAGHWSVEAYVQNLTNKRGITSIAGEGFYPNGAIAAGVIRPRTIGLTVGAKF